MPTMAKSGTESVWDGRSVCQGSAVQSGVVSVQDGRSVCLGGGVG